MPYDFETEELAMHRWGFNQLMITADSGWLNFHGHASDHISLCGVLTLCSFDCFHVETD